jgi:hypothetical protein
VSVFPKEFRQGHVPYIDSDTEHEVLIAEAIAEEALYGNPRRCTCYDPASMEYGPDYPCDWCRARDLTEIDLNGHDDKREPGWVA